MGTLAPAFLSVGALAEWAFRVLSRPGALTTFRAVGEPLKTSSRLTTCVSELLATARFFFGALAW